jgi:phosphate uptake regulator
MDDFESSPATRADIRRLDDKIGRLDLKVDAGVRRLDEKIDRLDLKVDSATARLAKEIVATQADAREIKATMATKTDVDRILAAVESFAGKAQAYDRAAVLHGQSLTEAEVTLRDHEKRLSVIEARGRGEPGSARAL